MQECYVPLGKIYFSPHVKEHAFDSGKEDANNKLL